MKKRIETVAESGRIPDDIREQHKGFLEWGNVSSRRDHQTILQIIIDGRDSMAVDSEGKHLPTLVYLAKEKRPQYNHRFKAGAVNALIRVSSMISNSPIILNVDCDMYSNNSDSVEIRGMDNYGGPPYMGTGCFHRRETLCGRKYRRGNKSVLEMGLKYGCPMEDVFTGFTIQCGGWRSIYFNPERKGFLGVAPTTLLQSLVQHKRWTEGTLQIFLSQYCPLLYGRGKIPLKLQLSYCVYLLWAANCLASLYYVTIPSLCLLRGISLFPKVSSQWSFPFIYTIMATSAYSASEFVWCGGTFRGWWNDQRMWVYKRTTSYFFGLLDNILRLLGITKSAFVVTAKVADDDVSNRYDQELMEFGAPSPMFTILTTLAWLNALSFIGVLLKLAMHGDSLDQLAMQIILCSLLVFVNQPIYEGMFFRKDKARMPTLVTYKSAVFALADCSLACV
ncbi:hypothetical protein NL676_019447 [Syzygium grande]|nr:hypothetical protein NL676_019447 [Syzygium grande]